MKEGGRFRILTRDAQRRCLGQREIRAHSTPQERYLGGFSGVFRRWEERERQGRDSAFSLAVCPSHRISPGKKKCPPRLLNAPHLALHAGSSQQSPFLGFPAWSFFADLGHWSQSFMSIFKSDALGCMEEECFSECIPSIGHGMLFAARTGVPAKIKLKATNMQTIYFNIALDYITMRLALANGRQSAVCTFRRRCGLILNHYMRFDRPGQEFGPFVAGLMPQAVPAA